MRKFVGLWLALIIVASAGQAIAGETTASRVFATASPSIVVVKAFDSSGQALAQGSGVVIVKGIIVSSCGVFEVANGISIFYDHKRYAAVLRYADIEHDLCSFKVKGLRAPPVKMRDASSLKVGESAYVVGAPEGTKVTLSSGLVSRLHKIPGGIVIQTTAAISPGSSGGGLFDSKGRLIGIALHYEKDGQKLNFVFPLEWIKTLAIRGKTAGELTKQAPPHQSGLLPGFKALLIRDYPRAFKTFQAFAKKGSRYAQLFLGSMYYNGQGVPQDYAKAAYWYRKAAEQGYAKAQNVLGFMYRDGRGVSKNYAKAVYWYHKSAKLGYANAQNNLGRMYYSGQGVAQDYAKAAYWYRKAAEQGYAAAQDNLGIMYYHGQGVAQDYAKAAYWYRKAAEQGYADAQVNLGVIYYHGQGVPQNYAKAAYWYRQAAKAGDSSAQLNLGTMYDQGRGVHRNYSKAAYWYQKAAEQKNAAAQAVLGVKYYIGQGVPRNYNKSAQFLRKAAEHGIPAAQELLGVSYALGRGVPQDNIQSTKWLTLAKVNGSTKTTKILGYVEKKMTTSQIEKAQNLAREWWAKRHNQ